MEAQVNICLYFDLLLTLPQMLEAELSKDIKRVPIVEFEIPKKIFTRYDVEFGVEDSLIVKLWDLN